MPRTVQVSVLMMSNIAFACVKETSYRQTSAGLCAISRRCTCKVDMPHLLNLKLGICAPWTSLLGWQGSDVTVVKVERAQPPPQKHPQTEAPHLQELLPLALGICWNPLAVLPLLSEMVEVRMEPDLSQKLLGRAMLER